MRAATEPNVEASVCGYCGMVCLTPREYHPYAACLMFLGCRDGDTVRDNLKAVIEYGKSSQTVDDFNAHR